MKQQNQPLVQQPIRAIGRNTLFGALSNLAQAGTRLVTVPFVIHYLGLGGYGIWNSIMMTAMYMRFGSVGVKTAFQKYVAEATGNGNYEKANTLLSTGCAAMLFLSVAGLVPIVTFSHHIARWSGIPPEFVQSGASAISLLGVIMLMSNGGAVYEAIVMGGHRIDLARKFNTILTILEAIGILLVLRLGYGLFAMACVMGTSELFFVGACYLASHKIVPAIRVRIEAVSWSVIYELLRFAGSYQLVNVLEVVYSWLIPFIILRSFGPIPAGLFAVVTRVVASATTLQDAFLGPILSGGTVLYASGSHERMQALVTKAFKVALGLTLFPLGFVCIFGPTMVYAWTGQSDPAFRLAFFFICGKGFFGALSILALVLYRISGRALLDNVRQLIRILMIAIVGLFAKGLGFHLVLAGLAFTELVGMLFMVYALTRTFQMFRATALLSDAARLATTAALVLGAGVIASYIPLPTDHGGRFLATLKLAEICLACLLAAWPSLLRTGAVTAAERAALFGAFTPGRN
jgi:O-antigen/teichoic acid export membrane protein